MTEKTEIFDLSKRYFEQQAEIYGHSFYLEQHGDFSRKQNQEAPTLDAFSEEIKNCQKCGLSQSRTQVVFGVGNPDANVMCIGEAPGHDEDRQGEPFVGAAGQLLNRILAAIGFEREEVYIANIVKCRPPENRNPGTEEAEACLPYLKRQIEMIQPKLILALGRVAAQNLLEMETSLGKMRNQVHDFGTIKVIVTYHPAALLRHAQWKRDAWEDVKRLRNLYDEIVGDKEKIEFKN